MGNYQKIQCQNPCLNVTERKGCKACRFEYSKKLFFKHAEERFGNLYDYSKFNYINMKTKSIIICKKHGEFLQSGEKHLLCKYACPLCFRPIKTEIGKNNKNFAKSVRKSYSANEFLNKLNLDYDKFNIDLSTYKNLSIGPIFLICKKHGRIKINTPNNLLITKYKCLYCGREATAQKLTKSYNEFLNDANQVYGNTYQYLPEPENFNRNSIIEIICSKHGIFKKKVIKFLHGQGCQECTYDKLIESGSLTGTYNLKILNRNPKLANTPSLIYYLKIGQVYKIGITRCELNNRLKTFKSQTKEDVIVLQTLNCTLKIAYKLEQLILETYKDFRIKTNWSTEVFSENVLKEKTLTDLLNLCIIKI